MENINYVGIDPSLTNTGIVILDRNGDIKVSCGSNPLRVTNSNPFTRLIKITEYVRIMVSRCVGNIVLAYEDYSFNSINKAFTLGELGGALKITLYPLVSTFILIPPTVVKMFAVGHGHASKQMLIEQAKKEEPRLFQNNEVSSDISSGISSNISSDICDAYFIAKLGMYYTNPQQCAEKWNFNTRKRLEIIRDEHFKVFVNR